MIAQLTKKTGNGDLYFRPSKIEEKLNTLAALPREELLTRVKIRDRQNPDHIPSECLLYFVRASRRDNDDTWFEQLYKVLTERVYRALPSVAHSLDHKTSLTQEAIRNGAFDRFVEMLAEDRQKPDIRLDFFEVRFNLAIKRLRLDAQEKAWRESDRSADLDDENTGEVSAKVEEAAGTIDPRDFDTIDDPLFRERLEAAIDSLPKEQSRTIHMIRQDIPMESDDPDVMTIAKALGTSGRSIRNYKMRALKSLQILFSDGEG